MQQTHQMDFLKKTGVADVFTLDITPEQLAREADLKAKKEKADEEKRLQKEQEGVRREEESGRRALERDERKLRADAQEQKNDEHRVLARQLRSEVGLALSLFLSTT